MHTDKKYLGGVWAHGMHEGTEIRFAIHVV